MLPDILAHKRTELQAIDRVALLDEMKEQVATLPPTHSLAGSLTRSDSISLIAEIKRRSPSKGVLANGIDPKQVAADYMKAGASAISVLTDKKYFDGSVDDLRAARATVSLPILRKDFIVDEFQVYEARLIGADALLLIAAALDPGTLERLYHLAYDIGLEVLLEVHDEAELMRVLPFAPKVIGVNNRDLKTFTSDLAVAERLRDTIGPTTICVAESGIHSREDMFRMQQAGYHAALIGEGIITASNRIARIHELMGTDANPS